MTETEAALSAPPVQAAPPCLDAALEYLALGYSVIPIEPGGKKPLVKWTQYQNRRASEEEVRQWYSKHPDAGVGIVTGALSELVVVDVDGKKGKDSLKSLGLDDAKLRTPTVKTGKGFHMYFKHPGHRVNNSAGKIMPGIDIRGDGGYVVAPLSRHQNGQQYDWIREFELVAIPLADLPSAFLGTSEGVQTPQAATNGSVSYADAPSGLEYTNDVGARERRYAEVALEKECALVASAGFGAQEDTLNKAALKIGNFVGAGVMEYGRAKDDLVNAGLGMSNQGGREPWAFEDISKKVDHGLRDGMEQPRDLSLDTDPNAKNAKTAKNQQSGSNFGNFGNFGSGLDLANGQFAPLDLSVADDHRRPPPKFPVDALGDFWGGFVEHCAEGAGAPVDYVAAGLLTSVSAIIGNARWVSPWGSWKEPPHLWSALVGNPSSGKTPAIRQFKPLLNKVEDEWGADYPERLLEWQTEAEAASAACKLWEAAVAEAVEKGKDPPKKPSKAVPPAALVKPRLIITDATVEVVALLLSAYHRGLLLHRDELAGWLGAMNKYGGSGDRAFWLETYTGDRYTVDRVRLNGDPIIVPYTSVSVLGTIQPGRLADTLLAETDDGMAARFLWCWPDPVPPRRPSGSIQWLPFEVALQRLGKLEMTSPSGQGETPSPRVLRLTDEAADLFSDWRVRNSKDEAAHAGLMVGHIGKMPGYVLRLALVIEYLCWVDGDEPENVGRATIEAAIQLVEEYWKPMAERVFGDASLPDTERQAKAVARWMLKEKPTIINAREFRRTARLPGLSKVKDVDAALDELVEAGWLWAPGAGGGPGTRGRPRKDYEVNPLVFQRTIH